jgi:hypothetical protein
MPRFLRCCAILTLGGIVFLHDLAGCAAQDSASAGDMADASRAWVRYAALATKLQGSISMAAVVTKPQHYVRRTANQFKQCDGCALFTEVEYDETGDGPISDELSATRLYCANRRNAFELHRRGTQEWTITNVQVDPAGSIAKRAREMVEQLSTKPVGFNWLGFARVEVNDHRFLAERIEPTKRDGKPCVRVDYRYVTEDKSPRKPSLIEGSMAGRTHLNRLGRPGLVELQGSRRLVCV